MIGKRLSVWRIEYDSNTLKNQGRTVHSIFFLGGGDSLEILSVKKITFILEWHQINKTRNIIIELYTASPTNEAPPLKRHVLKSFWNLTPTQELPSKSIISAYPSFLFFCLSFRYQEKYVLNTGLVRSIHRHVSAAREGEHQDRRHSCHAALPHCEYMGACNPIMIVVNTYCCISNFNLEHIRFLWT